MSSASGTNQWPQRVLFLAPRLGLGGMSRYLAELGGALQAMGGWVRVLTVEGPGITGQRAGMEEAGVEVHVVDRLTRGVLRREIGEHKTEVVKLFTGAFPPDTRLCLRLVGTGVPVVESIHSVPTRRRVRLGQRVFYRARRKGRYAAIVFDGDTEGLVRGTVPAGCVHRLRYGMRLPEAGLVGREDDELRFVTVCRLDEGVKDVSTLLRAFAEVRERSDRSGQRSARLTVVGQGPDTKRLRHLAADLGVRDRVTFAGWIDDPVETLRRSDVFVLSTRRESLGRVNIEAAAVGLPVIASRVAGCLESVADRVSGLLVEPGDVHALADAMIDLSVDGAARTAMGARGIEHAARFGLGAHTARILEIMNGVCARG